MEVFGLNKRVDALRNAFSVFDFSFFISGAVTLGFVALDLHYYGHDGILQLQGWTSVLIYILAIYVCGLMSWSVGKLMRWGILRCLWGKDGIKKDFDMILTRAKAENAIRQGENSETENLGGNNDNTGYKKMWIVIEKDEELTSKLSSLNKMWVMVAVFEGLAFSWIVGVVVYFDGWLVGKWIKTECFWYNFVPILVLVVLFVVSLHRATKYSRDLIEEVVVTYYNR